MTLTDLYWVREAGENITFAKINLYENHLSNAVDKKFMKERGDLTYGI